MLRKLKNPESYFKQETRSCSGSLKSVVWVSTPSVASCGLGQVSLCTAHLRVCGDVSFWHLCQMRQWVVHNRCSGTESHYVIWNQIWEFLTGAWQDCEHEDKAFHELQEQAFGSPFRKVSWPTGRCWGEVCWGLAFSVPSPDTIIDMKLKQPDSVNLSPYCRNRMKFCLYVFLEIWLSIYWEVIKGKQWFQKFGVNCIVSTFSDLYFKMFFVTSSHSLFGSLKVKVVQNVCRCHRDVCVYHCVKLLLFTVTLNDTWQQKHTLFWIRISVLVLTVSLGIFNISGVLGQKGDMPLCTSIACWGFLVCFSLSQLQNTKHACTLDRRGIIQFISLLFPSILSFIYYTLLLWTVTLNKEFLMLGRQWNGKRRKLK